MHYFSLITFPLSDAREKIKDDLTGLWNYEKFGCPHREGNRYFFSKNSGLQNQRFAMILTSLY